MATKIEPSLGGVVKGVHHKVRALAAAEALGLEPPPFYVGGKLDRAVYMRAKRAAKRRAALGHASVNGAGPQ